MPAHEGGAVDLTHPFSDGLTIQWPTADKFNFTVLHRDYVAPGRLGISRYNNVVAGQIFSLSLSLSSSFYYEANEFEQNEHAGTHMDAPAHFAKGRWRVDQIPFHKLNGPAAVIDFTGQTRHVPLCTDIRLPSSRSRLQINPPPYSRETRGGGNDGRWKAGRFLTGGMV